MSECPDFTHLLVLPRLRVQNANAVSSPLTHGFPAITAFLGLMWALERKTRSAGLDLRCKAVGVVCHDHQELVTDDAFAKAFRLTRNPVDKDGSTAAIVEEGRIHLTLSLVLAVQSNRWLREPDGPAEDVRTVAELLAALRIAGGTLLPATQPMRRRHEPFIVNLTGTEEDRLAEFRKARTRLLPGFALVARDDLLTQRFEAMQAQDATTTRLDAWLSLARINWRYHAPENDTREEREKAWKHDRKGLGWIVPIPVGYGALGDVHAPGTVANTRDATTPFRFVESLFSVGEWISPHRLYTPLEMLWYPSSQPEAGLYRCRNDYRPVADEAEWESDFN